MQQAAERQHLSFVGRGLLCTIRCVFLASHPSSSFSAAAAAYVPTDLCLFIFHLITGRSEAIIHGLCKPPLIHPIQSAIDNAIGPCTRRRLHGDGSFHVISFPV